MDLLYVERYLSHTERQADGWPIGVSEEGKKHLMVKAKSLLNVLDTITVKQMAKFIEGDHTAMGCILYPKLLEAIAHRALIAADAVETFTKRGV